MATNDRFVSWSVRQAGWVLRGGKRAWTHFTCTAPLSRGPRDYGRARFRLHVLDNEKRFITSDGRFLR